MLLVLQRIGILLVHLRVIGTVERYHEVLWEIASAVWRMLITMEGYHQWRISNDVDPVLNTSTVLMVLFAVLMVFLYSTEYSLQY